MPDSRDSGGDPPGCGASRTEGLLFFLFLKISTRIHAMAHEEGTNLQGRSSMIPPYGRSSRGSTYMTRYPTQGTQIQNEWLFISPPSLLHLRLARPKETQVVQNKNPYQRSSAPIEMNAGNQKLPNSRS